MLIERGRHYGDANMYANCDCYDRSAAQRGEEESFARHVAANREADDLMAAANRGDVLDDLDELSRRIDAADRTTSALGALRTLVLVCVIVPAVGFVAVKGIANTADIAEAAARGAAQ